MCVTDNVTDNIYNLQIVVLDLAQGGSVIDGPTPSSPLQMIVGHTGAAPISVRLHTATQLEALGKI